MTHSIVGHPRIWEHEIDVGSINPIGSNAFFCPSCIDHILVYDLYAIATKVALLGCRGALAMSKHAIVVEDGHLSEACGLQILVGHSPLVQIPPHWIVQVSPVFGKPSFL